ncbi:MAG: AMP-binding protein [Gemmatimonadaceae bacterium]|nr:AMP-binding protein [Gemmatimonadaceae bacterium]
MADPLSILPLALAAAGGRVDDAPCQQLIAAGLTLLQRSAPLVRALAGRRAAILLPTGPAFLTALAACDGRGAVLLNPLAAPPELAWQLQDAEVGAVITIAALATHLPADTPMVLMDDVPRTARVVIEGRAKDVDLGSHHGLALSGTRDVEGHHEECVIVYTSAMAGRLRGARLSHRNLLANARSAVLAMGLTPDDHSLALLPFAHLFGLTVSAAAPLLAGGRITTMARFNPVRALELIEQQSITRLIGVPAIFAALVQAIERRGVPATKHRLQTCICGGAPLSPTLQEQFAELTGVELRQGYGLTEAAPVCLANTIAHDNRRGTLGVAMPDVAVTIRDPATGAVCPTGVDGEICVRGPNVFMGYVRGATDGLAIRDGWLHTGDLGAADADGVIVFRGLLKAMFTHNGFNIYPRELERVIGELPGVLQVRVQAIPDPVRGHDIGVDVTGRVSESDVRRWCETQLSLYKQPSLVHVRSPDDSPI